MTKDFDPLFEKLIQTDDFGESRLLLSFGFIKLRI